MALHSTKFWDFSNQLYDKDGVAEICLKLQGEFGVDVNLFLFCYWIAHFKYAPSEIEWTQILEFSKSWKTKIVQPLRNTRKSLKKLLKSHPQNSDFAKLLKKLKSDELLAEKIQQEAIQSLLKHREADAQAFSSKDAMINLSYYFSTLDIAQTEELKSGLLKIAESIIYS